LPWICEQSAQDLVAGDAEITDAETCLAKSVDRYRQTMESMNLILVNEGYNDER